MSEFAANLHQIIKTQRAAQREDGPPSEAIRISRLNRLAQLLKENIQEIADALSSDFGHRSYDHSLIEIWSTVLGLEFTIKHVGDWMKPEAREPLAPDAKAIVEFVPKGVVGIMGPWNVPFYLMIGPLAGIFAAGNRAIIKPSEFLPKSSALLQRLVAQHFTAEELAVVLGGASEGAEFTASPFDHIMFTGSTAVGKLVMKSAADNLVPVTLELGGKCPTIITDSYELDEAAARIMAVKAFNAGQVCVAPDYIYVPAGKEDAFVDACVAATKKMYPEGISSPDYTSMVNDHHFERMAGLVADAKARGAKIVQAISGEAPRRDRRFPLTLVLNPPVDAKVMKEEIFGPIMPVFSYQSLDAVVKEIASRDHPLSLFLFSRNEKQIRFILDNSTSGGVTVNDVMANIYPDDLPFGGAGASGMGRYHTKYGFESFSHVRSVYYQSDIPEQVGWVRPPFNEQTRRFFLEQLGL